MPSDTFKRYRPGDKVTPTTLNSQLPGLHRTIIGGNGVSVQSMGNQVVIGPPGTGPLPRALSIFVIVVAEFADYLTCRLTHPSTGSTGGTFSVAKPYMLMRTPFDNLSTTFPDGAVSYVYSQHWERVATRGASETQIVTPRYWVGEQLRAIRGNVGINDLTPRPIVYQDINTAGRHWAAT
jgi:hypothetical protein